MPSYGLVYDCLRLIGVGLAMLFAFAEYFVCFGCIGLGILSWCLDVVVVLGLYCCGYVVMCLLFCRAYDCFLRFDSRM